MSKNTRELRCLSMRQPAVATGDCDKTTPILPDRHITVTRACTLHSSTSILRTTIPHGVEAPIDPGATPIGMVLAGKRRS